MDDVDAARFGLFRRRQHARIGLKMRILGAERQYLHVVAEHEGHPQIVERNHLRHYLRVLMGDIHRDVATVGMTDEGDVVVVGVFLPSLQFGQGEKDVGLAADIDLAPPDILLTDMGHQRRIARQVLLDAGNEITARREHVGEEGILGGLDGVAVADDSKRELPESEIGLGLVVAPHRDFDRNRPLARGIEQSQNLMADREPADHEILADAEDAEKSQDYKHPFHGSVSNHFGLNMVIGNSRIERS
ncbi:hypothetical protein IVA80_19240 [Bradyrhizobium sp. 139]|nr:hypothetical protein [Bradyrhizobium sp. 139]